MADVSAICLTHIHIDHAGATGALVRENPRIRVYVHERGAPHVIDPSRLLESARRLYGNTLDNLFGELMPVPSENVIALRGGERIELAGRRIEVAYTPGHANHHVAYLDASSGTAFVGDTAGIRDQGVEQILPVTPPPDIDLDRWDESLDRIAAWRADRLFLTHFGTASPVREHLERFRDGLADWAARVRASLAEPGDDTERAAHFARAIREDLRRHLGEKAEWYAEGAEPEFSWHGLARYWRQLPGRTQDAPSSG